MKIKPIKQKDGTSCGPASIKMATDFLGFNYSYAKISNISQYKKREGLFNCDLIETIKKLGLECEERTNSTWEDLIKYNKKDSVIILSWMLRGYIGHFSVLEKVDKKYIYLADPEAGKIIKLQKLVFLRLWFDYDGAQYPKVSNNIQLRWTAIIKKGAIV